MPSPGSGRPLADAVLFRLLVQNVADYAIFMIDADGCVISWNPGAERIKGYRETEVLGRHFSMFYRPEEIAAGAPRAHLDIAAERGRFAEEGWRVRKNGELFRAEVVLTAVHDENGKHVGFAKITRDVTEQRQLQAERADRHRLFAASVHAQESERRRIAWDVHDDSIQAMIAVSMRLQVLSAGLAHPLRGTLEELNEAIQGAVRRLRQLVAHLRPAALDEADLAGALRGYLGDVVAGWGLEYSLRYGLEEPLPPELVVTAFRIVQEALVNVHKHAHASRVDVAVAARDGGFEVRVADDGRGIDEREAATVDGEHIGMVAMRERAEAARGRLRVDSEPGEGVTVLFWLPGGAAHPDEFDA